MDSDPANPALCILSGKASAIAATVPGIFSFAWIAVILLLISAAFLAASETALSSLRVPKIKARADKGDSRAIKVVRVLDEFDRAITSILILTNIVHLSAAGIVTVEVTRIWGLGAVTISTVVSTIIVFFVGEMLPKSIAKKYAESISLAVAPIIWFFMCILKPVSLLLSKIGNLASRLTKEEAEKSVTEDELYEIIEDMTENGSIEEEHGELISSALQFGNVSVNSIITSRVDVCMINIEATPDEILSTIKEQHHSRIPVYEDTVDNIIGILQIRTYIKEYLKKGSETKLRELLDEPFFVHSSIKIDDLLAKMSKECINMAIVTDSYGGTRGIVTVEDILEELVGEIWDEDDEVKEPIRKLSEDSYLCDDNVQIGDVFEAVDFKETDEDDEFLTKLMGEWAYETFGSIPKVGDSFDYHGLTVKVFSMDHNRITGLSVTYVPETESEEGGEDK